MKYRMGALSYLDGVARPCDLADADCYTIYKVDNDGSEHRYIDYEIDDSSVRFSAFTNCLTEFRRLTHER